MHRERDRRLAAAWPLQIRHGRNTLGATSEDVARHGLYARTSDPLPQGAETLVEVTLPDRGVVSFPARVAHSLPDVLARPLGRAPGMGLEISGEPPEAWLLHVKALEDATAAQHEDEPLTIVILDRDAAFRERLESNLRAAGFAARSAGDVATALETCRQVGPDILLADGRTQGSNPLLVLKLLSGEPTLADIAVVLMSEDCGEQVRLHAYRRGVRDVIPKPFTEEELMIRLRRVGARSGRGTRHVSLRGVLEDVSVPTVLALLEYEKRPGTLVLVHETRIGRILVSDGRVRRAELADAGSSLEALGALLPWHSGSFAFLPGTVEGADEVDMTISQVLLEHARVSDEG